jgi:CheY-like chemotaxis protein
MLPLASSAQARSAAVLLVDDNPANLLALEAVLRPIGVRTVSALTAKAALLHLQQDSFAAALIDVQMPEMDGFQLAQRIRKMERGRQLPILFITAIYHDERYVAEGYAHGAADYITKPFDPNIVRSRVKAFVDLFEQREHSGALRRASGAPGCAGRSLLPQLCRAPVARRLGRRRSRPAIRR